MNNTHNMAWMAHVPTGWRSILEDVIAHLHALDPLIRIKQAKEKFGSLRIYLDHGGSEAYAIVDAATAASQKTCEICGEAGHLMRTADGYYSTRGPCHAADFFPVEEAPTVTLRIFVDRSEENPRADPGDAATSNEGGS